MQADDIVTVAITSNPLEGEAIANSLRAEGIACELEGTGQAGVVGNVEIRVLVRAWDADRARKGLRDSQALTVSVPPSAKGAAEGAGGLLVKKENNVRRVRRAAKARHGLRPA